MDGYTLRHAMSDDFERYYGNFNPVDSELVQLTGCKSSFTKDEVKYFFEGCISSNDKYLFLILQNDDIIGETVINEIDFFNKHANFRIAIFKADCRNKGLGTWAIKQTCNFAFNCLRLHRLSLEVFSFNSRAKAVYLKCGFKQEGILREAVRYENSYHDIIVMSILSHEWIDNKCTENSNTI